MKAIVCAVVGAFVLGMSAAPLSRTGAADPQNVETLRTRGIEVLDGNGRTRIRLIADQQGARIDLHGPTGELLITIAEVPGDSARILLKNDEGHAVIIEPFGTEHAVSAYNDGRQIGRLFSIALEAR
jgi:hypothetical protein